jgi:hypothetical protein
MIADNPIDIICAVLWSIAGSIPIGAHWTRREWVSACRKRRLIRNDANTGKLVWHEGGEGRKAWRWHDVGETGTLSSPLPLWPPAVK